MLHRQHQRRLHRLARAHLEQAEQRADHLGLELAGKVLLHHDLGEASLLHCTRWRVLRESQSRIQSALVAERGLVFERRFQLRAKLVETGGIAAREELGQLLERVPPGGGLGAAQALPKGRTAVVRLCGRHGLGHVEDRAGLDLGERLLLQRVGREVLVLHAEHTGQSRCWQAGSLQARGRGEGG